jgi:hypothetical protein
MDCRKHPDGEIFLSLFRDPRSVVTAAELLAEIGDCRARYPTRDALAPTPARPPSLSSPANARQPASGGDATSDRAERSAHSLTAPATGTPGRKTGTRPPAPAPAATSILAHYAPSDARGAGSVGLLARPDPIRPGPPPRPTATHRSHHPNAVGPPSLNWRPAGPSAKRLTASRHPLQHSGVDTGRLLRQHRKPPAPRR